MASPVKAKHPPNYLKIEHSDSPLIDLNKVVCLAPTPFIAYFTAWDEPHSYDFITNDGKRTSCYTGYWGFNMPQVIDVGIPVAVYSDAVKYFNRATETYDAKGLLEAISKYKYD